MFLIRCLMLMLLVPSWVCHAGPRATQDAFDRLEEVLQLRLEDGLLKVDDVVPAIVVRTEPRYEASVPWFGTRSLEVLTRVFGANTLRLCEACMAPRTLVEEGSLNYQSGHMTIDEVVHIDEVSRGSAQPAKAAIWIEETPAGVSIRIVDLATSQVRFAQNIDPNLIETKNTRRIYTLSEELERRSQGRSITQAFVDVAVLPGAHISLDWTEQWGPSNRNLSGFTLSLFDPVLGMGGATYRTLKPLNIMVGGKFLVSIPTSLVRSVGEDLDSDFLDPLVTVVGVARVPFGRSNYGLVATASTNGEVGIGLSLMNISLLPVIP